MIGIVAVTSMNVVIGGILNIDKELILTTLPQLATMPIALSLADQIGGIPSMTSSFVVVAGITGAIIGPTVLKFFSITSTIGKGVGMGCASHIIGVSRLVKEGEKEATIGSVTMIVTGILISILIPYGTKFIFKCNGDDNNDNMVYSYIICFGAIKVLVSSMPTSVVESIISKFELHQKLEAENTSISIDGKI